MSWANRNLQQNSVVIVPENFQGFAVIYLRPDFQVRIAPPTLKLALVLSDSRTSGLSYAVYYNYDVGNAKVEVLAGFGKVEIYNITNWNPV